MTLQLTDSPSFATAEIISQDPFTPKHEIETTASSSLSKASTASTNILWVIMISKTQMSRWIYWQALGKILTTFPFQRQDLFIDQFFFSFKKRKERYKRKLFIGPYMNIRTKQRSDRNEFRVLTEKTPSQKDRGKKTSLLRMFGC